MLKTTSRYLLAACVSLAAAAAVVWGPWLLCDSVTLYRWDNVEHFAPIINWAHSNLLRGELPRVNLAQQLGDPFATHIQAGYFYPFYTVPVWLNMLHDGSYKSLITTIALLHFALGISGYRAVAGLYGIRAPLAWGLATAAIAGAYTMAYAGVWIVVLAVQAWMPWCVYGIIRYARASDARDLSGLLIYTLGSTMIGSLGHAQFWAYAHLFLGLAGVGCLHKQPHKLLYWMVAAVIAVFLSMPTLLPMLYLFPELQRAAGLTQSEFLALSTPWRELAGFISPWTAKGTDALPPSTISLLSFQGAHIVPLLLAGLWLLLGERDNRMRSAHHQPGYGTLWLGLFALAVVFALGENTPVYPLTYHFPLWSAFRWPVKFMLFAQCFLSLCAIWAVHRVQTSNFNPKLWRALCAITALTLVVMFIWHHRGPNEEISMAALTLLLVSVAMLALMARRQDLDWVQNGLAALLLVSSISYAALVHEQQLKPFEFDYQHRVHNFEGPYRVTPTTEDTPNLASRMSELDLGLTATVQGYVSLSGYHSDTTVLRYSEVVENFIFGSVARHWLSWAGSNNILNFLAVRYGVAWMDEDFAVLEKSRFNHKSTINGVRVYENSDALEYVFFAERSYPDALDWTRPPRTVRLVDQAERAWASGILDAQEYTRHGDIKASGHALGDALLVTSTLALPGWKVSVNGGPEQPPLVVNDHFLAVELPEGPFTLRWRYTPPGLRFGVAAATAGLLMLLVCCAFWYHGLTRKRSAQA